MDPQAWMNCMDRVPVPPYALFCFVDRMKNNRKGHKWTSDHSSDGQLLAGTYYALGEQHILCSLGLLDSTSFVPKIEPTLILQDDRKRNCWNNSIFNIFLPTHCSLWLHPRPRLRHHHSHHNFGRHSWPRYRSNVRLGERQRGLCTVEARGAELPVWALVRLLGELCWWNNDQTKTLLGRIWPGEIARGLWKSVDIVYFGVQCCAVSRYNGICNSIMAGKMWNERILTNSWFHFNLLYSW